MSLSGKYSSIPFKIVGIIFLLISTCAGQMSNLYAEVNDGLKNERVKRIGIEEFQIQNRLNNSNVSSIDPGTGIKVADIFYKELSSYKHYDLIAPAEMPFRIELVKTPGATAEMPLNQTKKPQPGMLKAKSKDLMEIPDANLIDLDFIVTRVISRYGGTDLDAVVAGVITRYDDKDGSAMAVNKPASVAFIAYLISLKDKKILWSGHFAETQSALFDNLLLVDRFLQAGGQWLSSDDLTQLVMQRAIKTFPGLNQNKVKLISK